MTHDEVQRLEVGSLVFYGKHRKPRIVRSVSYWKGKKRAFGFAIMKCSHYQTATTTYVYSDVRALFEWTGIKIRLDSVFDRCMDFEFNHPGNGGKMCCRYPKDMGHI